MKRKAGEGWFYDQDLLSLEEILPAISQRLQLLQGKILSVEYEEETNFPRLVTAEIPAKNYLLFLEKLGELGEVPQPLPSVPAGGEEPLRLQIKNKIIPSD